MSVQSTPRRSVAKQAATARRLIASSHPIYRVLEATVEIYDSRDIIYKPGKYGELFLIRSKRFPTRYYPVTCRDGVWTCDAQNASYYIRLAQQYCVQAA